MVEDTLPGDLFSVVALGIVFNPEKKEVLIERIENDPYVKELSWRFPGGSLKRGENVTESLNKHIKEKTGYDVENLGCIFSRTFPELKNLLLVYYLCEVKKGEGKVGRDVKEIKWVKAGELRKYFTTSFDPALEEYINNLS